MHNPSRPYKRDRFCHRCWWCGNPLGLNHAVLRSPDGHPLIVHRLCSTSAQALLDEITKETTTC